MGASGLASNISCFGKMEISCSLISGRFLSVGPDGIRQERPVANFPNRSITYLS